MNTKRTRSSPGNGDPTRVSGRRIVGALSFSGLLLAVPAGAQESHAIQPLTCTALFEAAKTKKAMTVGDCETRVSPASTFKLPLAVMGYDAGVLVDAGTPVWEVPGAIESAPIGVRHANPSAWQAQSLIWYSRELTRTLGRSRLERYITQFSYGNMDVSRGPGNSDGVISSWLGGSLRISPVEQLEFLDALLHRKLAASVRAQQAAIDIVPRFQSPGGWRIHGKTGSNWLHDHKGRPIKDRPIGWFVGWAERGSRTVLFASLNVGSVDKRLPHGLEVRDQFLSRVDSLLE